jgi:colicin import membrane protein
METRTDQARALILTVLLHVAGLALFWLSASWAFAPRQEAASGEPISASLQLSSADMQRARAAIAEAAKAREEAAPKPQPLPSPRPQTSDTPLQPKPQAPQDRPDSVDQQAIDRNALRKAEQLAQEQEERRRQEQVDLTEEIKRQQEAERRQQLARQQLEAIRREREAASQRTLMEEQRLRQLADRRSASTPTPNASAATAAPSGDRGADESLRARYKAALNATARANWNTGMAPELVHCKVSFTQRTGGTVMRVDFIDCPYDERGRDSVERALLKSPMPYQGFESVFERTINLEFCHPDEACN